MRLTRLLWAIAVILSSVAVGGHQASVPSMLSASLRAHLAQERLQIVTSTRGLPLGVRDALQELFGGQLLEIAALQEKSTLADPALPIPRLTLAGCSTDHCLVYYERGGTTSHVALFHWTPAATRLELGGIAPRGLSSIDAVLKAMLSGTIKRAPADE